MEKAKNMDKYNILSLCVFKIIFDGWNKKYDTV